MHKLKVSFAVIAPIIGVIVAMVLLWNQYVFTSDLILLAVFYVLTVLGITIGYHRMLTHQGFQTFWPVRLFFLICGAMAWEGTPSQWAATHIRHHAHSDEEGDPHSPLEGFWHAHFGWLFMLSNIEDPKKYAPQLLKDPVVRFVDKTILVWFVLSLALPFALGGWTGLVWGGFVRIFLMNHVTWSVNSICHTFGKKDFQTTDESRNHWVVGLLALGEGWHNNHHAFPKSAFHGLKWWQVDGSGLLIALMEKLGLVWKVERVSPKALQAKESQDHATRSMLGELREKLMHSIQEKREALAHHPALEKKYQQMSDRLETIQKYLEKKKSWKRHTLLAYEKEIKHLTEVLADAGLLAFARS